MFNTAMDPGEGAERRPFARGGLVVAGPWPGSGLLWADAGARRATRRWSAGAKGSHVAAHASGRAYLMVRTAHPDMAQLVEDLADLPLVQNVERTLGEYQLIVLLESQVGVAPLWPVVDDILELARAHSCDVCLVPAE